MSNICGRCKRPMSSHDDHGSCPQCRIAAGECNLDVHNPCSICGGWTSKQRRSLVDARARASQRGRQHWTSAFSQLEAWIMSRPALSASSSGPASEISSLVSGDGFSDRLPVSTSVSSAGLGGTSSKWGQYGVWYGKPSTATTAPTAPAMPLMAGTSTIEPIVAPLGAQGMPSVIQRARPVVSTEQRMQSTAVYGTLPYASPAMPYMAPLQSTAPLPYASMPAMPARPSYSMGYYGQGNQFPLMTNPNWMSERESRCYNISSFRNGSSLKLGELAKPSLSPPLVHWGFLLRLGTMLRSFQGGQPVLRGLDLKTRLQIKPLNVPGLLQHLADPPFPRGTTLGGLAQPQGHLRPVLNGLSTDLLLSRTLKPLKLTPLRCCQTCFNLSLVNLPPSSIRALEAKGILRLRRLWLPCPPWMWLQIVRIFPRVLRTSLRGK